MKWKTCLLPAALALPLTAIAAINQPVKVSGGSVQGVPGKDASITVFKGIPYAAPPVGDLRWRAPEAVVGWEGIRKADKFGNSCIQKIVYERKPWTYEFMAHADISEDCLFLNVWTPARSNSDKLAVYVFIHGGGNIEGSGEVPAYDGEGLAKKGVVVVTVNYRLGIFGNFAHPELSAEAPQHTSGNYAELDLIAALKWVKQNIAQFGGDPDRVTIGGQSAGSGHVHSMVASPLAKGLFQGAINESGTGIGTDMMGTSLADMEQLGISFAKAKGAKSIADLRKLSWQEITDTIPASSPNAAPPTFRFGSVVDGYVFNATPLDTIAQGKQNDVPTLVGGNRDEGGVAPGMKMSLDAFSQLVLKRYDEMADEFLKHYPVPATPEEAGAVVSQGAWDQNRTSLYLWAKERAKTAKTPVFSYFWTHPMPGPDVAIYGAFHTSEIPYAMNTLSMSDRPFTSEDLKIADTLSSYWANFIKTGDPNGPGLPHWPSMNEKPGMVMEVGDHFGPIPIAADKAKQEFMEKYLTTKPRQALRP